MISVAMAVYNGRSFLREQLQSIALQTMKPDEIVIIDDKSPINCDDIISDFMETYYDIKVVYKKHEVNMGYASTFFDALFICNGDYIFLCDQDDIWLPNKIVTMINTLSADEKILCLSSLNILIDCDGNELKREKATGKDVYCIFLKSLLTQRLLRPGMTLLIRRQIIELIKAIDYSNFKQHDRLIEFLACERNGLYIINRYLNKYRIHSSNTSGLNMGYRNRINNYDRAMKSKREADYLIELRQQFGNENNIMEIERQIKFYNTRYKLLFGKSCLKYLFKMIPYYSRSNGIRQVVGDLSSIYKGVK